MHDVLTYLRENHEQFVDLLREQVAVPSISTDGAHAAEIDASADVVARHMYRAGLENVEILRYGDSYPYVFGEWCRAPGRPTVFLYSHHDVQPCNTGGWESDPWVLTRRGGRLYGRGSADDKGGTVAQLASIEAWLRTHGSLPVNVKMLVEGEEEIGSKNLQGFFQQYKDRIHSDVIVVTDTGNLQAGLPCLTYSLRGIVEVIVEVQTLKQAVHSGEGGGTLPDAAIALNVILSRLYANQKKYPVPGLYDQVRKLTKKELADFKALPFDVKKYRKEGALLPGLEFATPKGMHVLEQKWRQPAITVIAQEASSFRNKSNQVLPSARALISVRIVPDQKPKDVFKALKALLTKDPPYGCKVNVSLSEHMVDWWMTDPTGPAFDACMQALRSGFGRKPHAIGSGGAIGFVGPLAKLFGGAPALLVGIEDPMSQAHSQNESLNEGEFTKVMASLVHLYENLGALPGGKVK
ncbi:MAG TPA: M20/M25/M40 family metallo-hydrolase [Gemmatales bacterium]|nr:M20/M25/M40 family metallo-hydrolase [Gemmatales bacterium]HMP60820.1 M20/M25/M40 family metallo-hydrolase [Gemmatales bacterium]